jgi:gamma-polyglutamate biosynthesis protein CapC
MDGHVLTLFPPYGIDQTLHVAILIGLIWSLTFTELFGWTFSGLVVPGYLASLLVLEPASGGAVVIESVLTFLIARALSDFASRSGAWSKFFGRERFLLVIFVSIAVRQACELWLLPELARLVDARFDTTFRLSRTLSSIGLVLVPLTANAMWKVGLRRGAIAVAVPTAITFAILAYVLLPHTNLSFSRLELTYENIALDFLSSGKAYILLVCGAFLASRYNLKYGWDYAGILIPALLGIALVSPLRLVTTLVEALVLVLCVRGLVLLPGLRTLNLEGPRKVALVFAVSFAIKWTLGWFVGPTVHGLKVVELFGFGYLLSSLVAVKILQKDGVSRIVVPAFAVGGLAWLVGSSVGFAVDKVAPASPAERWVPPVAVGPAPAPTTTLTRTAMGVMALGHVRARLPEAGVDTPTHRDREQYARLWSAIARWLDGDRDAERDVADRATALGLTLAPLREPFGGRAAWALYRSDERLAADTTWDTAVLVPGARGPVITVPRPATELPTAEVAPVLCLRVECRAMIVSGLDTASSGTPHAIARRAFGAAPMFELRSDASAGAGHPLFYVADDVPNVDVSALWHGIELSWDRAPARAGSGGVLRANPADYWQQLATTEVSRVRGVGIEAWIAKWSARTPFLPVGAAQPPSPSELRFLDVALATPALAHTDLRAIRTLAALVDYDVVLLADGAGEGRACWLLAETKQPRARGWGALIARTGKAAPITVEIPRPRREAGTLRLGVEVFRRVDASVLIVADPDVSPERADADPAAPWNLATSLHAFHQAAFHAARDGAVVLQLRGFGATQPVADPLVVSMWRPILSSDQVPPALAALTNGAELAFLGRPRFFDGSRELLDLAGTGNPQLEYCERYESTPCALLWVSEPTRAAYREADRERELTTFAKLGIATTTATPIVALVEPVLEAGGPMPAALQARYDALARIAEGYALDGNAQRLRLFAGATVRGGYSEEVGRAFLTLEVREGDRVIRGLVLVPGGSQRIAVSPGPDLVRRVDAALAHRPLSIQVSGRLR